MRRVGLLGVIAVLLGIVMVSPSEAILTINPDLCQSGGGSGGACPSDPWNWIKAEITGTGTLTMTLTASLENEDLNVTSWWFNLRTTVAPDGAILTFDQISGDDAVQKIGSLPPDDSSDPFVVTVDQNRFNVDGGGRFDLQFDFNNGGPLSGQFNGTDVLVFNVTCSNCIGVFDENVFNAASTGGGTTEYFGAPGSPSAGTSTFSPFRTIATLGGAGSGGHIAGVGGRGTEQVPLPATLFLVGGGFIGLGVLGRKRLGKVAK